MAIGSTYGFFASDIHWIADAELIPTYVSKRLGSNKIGVELDTDSTQVLFEEATLEYSKLINAFQIKNWLPSALGATSQDWGSNVYDPFGTSGDGLNYNWTDKFAKRQQNLLKRMGAQYASEVSVGGDFDLKKLYIVTQDGESEYDMFTNSYDAETGELYNASGDKFKRFEVKEVWHYGPPTVMRFYDPYYANTQMMFQEDFNFQAYNTSYPIYYVMNLFDTVLRAQYIELLERVRRSPYTWHIQNNTLRLTPIPTTSGAKVYFLAMLYSNPIDDTGDDPYLDGITGPHDIPYYEIEYKKINSTGRQWIRNYTYALSKELLGHIRGKFASIPIPGDNITLDGDSLVTEGRDEQANLRTELTDYLEEISYEKMLQREADMAEAIETQYKLIPTGIIVR
jgi:hypothetical protein